MTCCISLFPLKYTQKWPRKQPFLPHPLIRLPVANASATQQLKNPPQHTPKSLSNSNSELTRHVNKSRRLNSLSKKKEKKSNKYFQQQVQMCLPFGMNAVELFTVYSRQKVDLRSQKWRKTSNASLWQRLQHIIVLLRGQVS